MSTASQNITVSHVAFASPAIATVSAAIVVIASCLVLHPTGNTAILIPLLAIATLFDLSCFRIPNWLTYTSAASGLGVAAICSGVATLGASGVTTWWGPVGFIQAITGCLTGFGVMSFVFVLAGRGAGDVKLAAAIGALVGPVPILAIMLWAHLIAAGFVFVWIVCGQGPVVLLLHFVSKLANCCLPGRFEGSELDLREVLRRPIPLAGFFSLSSILVLGGLIQ